MNRATYKQYGSEKFCKRIYLVAPKHPDNFWSMQGTADVLGAKTLMPNAALATLMALTPAGIDIRYTLADENISTIDFDYPCDLVAITGGTLHARRIHDLCDRFKQKGRQIALGGTYASIEHDRCDGLADYLFVGEAEYTWPLFLKQWTTGTARKVYTQEEYIDMKDSPPPDWSLISAGDYVNLSIQTSRGCPNQCDFCDVIQYVGRNYRTKSIEQILAELDNALDIGARTVFFSDDNFLGNKQFTRELLSRVIAWNVQQERPLSFSTQITVQVADDDELLKMFADAKFSVLFLGVETVRKESLAEVHKSRNVDRDIFERIRKISRYGIVPFIGLIVGFDNDDEGVFKDLEDFLNATDSPIAGVSLLNAPRHTPLYKRLRQENRLTDNSFSGEWQLQSNIIPKQMTPERLNELYWDFFQKLYKPDFFEDRFLRWLQNVDYFSTVYVNRKADAKQMVFGIRIFKYFLFNADRDVRMLFFRMLRKTWKINPKLMRRFFTVITQYTHFHSFVEKGRKP
ncbi:MAG: radical SAM protein [Candidatus Electrothrix scaldis]|nr:MAG: radical SAM protein [Candidatus Electrothrix sp. GW3-3]